MNSDILSAAWRTLKLFQKSIVKNRIIIPWKNNGNLLFFSLKKKNRLFPRCRVRFHRRWKLGVVNGDIIFEQNSLSPVPVMIPQKWSWYKTFPCLIALFFMVNGAGLRQTSLAPHSRLQTCGNSSGYFFFSPAISLFNSKNSSRTFFCSNSSGSYSFVLMLQANSQISLISVNGIFRGS